ncbi:MAG: AAA family ATPase [Gemmatimonadota bacterium]|nr:AAA family ATPase [Gemmatimonadota bacterium]MDE2984752.1 AAA family ATPase [Gemmatimonadota bacterium]
MTLRKAGGNWVSGDRFFDREVEIEALMERVEDGVHTLVTAQRRMGKTSLVHELLRRLEERGDFETVFVDLEDAFTAADAVVEIAAASLPVRGVVRRITDWVRKSSTATIDRVDELGVSELRVKLRAGIDSGRWRARGDVLFASLAKSEKPVVLAIDELPILVNRLVKGHDYRITPERRQDADGFLSWLRKASQAHRGRIRLVVSGSVGLEPILEQAELSAHANVFAPFELRPWDEDTSVACLGELAESYRLRIPAGVRRTMFRRLRCGIPHHVQQFFDRLHEHLRRHGRSEASLHLTDDSIRRYETYRSVLSGESAAQIKYVLHVIEHDGYLARHDDGYRFVSGLVEDWWRARNSGGFVPFSERHA